MSKRNSKSMDRSPATVESFRVFPDASGAPAVVSYSGYVYAFDFLGELKCNNIRPVSGSRVTAKIAKEVCERAYRQAFEAATDASWLQANATMYGAE